MSGAPPRASTTAQGCKCSGNAINAVKQRRNQLEAVPVLAGVPNGLADLEKKSVPVQNIQTFELPDTERIDRDEALDKLAHASQSKYLYENNLRKKTMNIWWCGDECWRRCRY